MENFIFCAVFDYFISEFLSNTISFKIICEKAIWIEF